MADNEGIVFSQDPTTGAIRELKIQGDNCDMNWIVATDGSQYPWIKQDYGWGLGYFTETIGKQSVRQKWGTPIETRNNPSRCIYQAGNIHITVERRFKQDNLVEQYTFTNKGENAASLSDVGIYTPFNDNYPNAKECVNTRTHAHIWTGENAAYINALRMGGFGPNVGLVVTKGSVRDYEIWERGREKGNSHTRGIIALNLPDILLQPEASYTLEWQIFPHNGNEDFRRKLLEKGSVIVTCNKYVFEAGDTARVILRSQKALRSCQAKINGMPVDVSKNNPSQYEVKAIMQNPGEVRFDFFYDGNKQTHADCLVISKAEAVLQKRTDFIRTHQQMNNPKDLRYGAYMVYDNEGDSIYLNYTPNCNPVDRDEGAERVGMGVLLAKRYLQTKQAELKSSLEKYARFVRNKLQTEDYVTYSSVDQKGRNRGYNYQWVAHFYFLMYQVTGDKQFAIDGYRTLMSFYRQFGHGFYAIGVPVCLSIQVLENAGMKAERDTLLNHFRQTGDIFVRNGTNYPAHEVNYEQSIVAPALELLAQLYLVTNNSKYLNGVKRQLPVLEAFNGFQPSFHLNDIAIRHWDDYWFGKREMFGDTFPHYWSTVTAGVFHYYYLCTGDIKYQQRAENIVRNNLCLFFEDGRASCAYVYPQRVNGADASFYDPYANDQDWALVYYLLVNEKKQPGDAVITNGIPWFDTQGRIVNAHGACIVEDNGRYYLFGEYKSDTSNAFPGFSCYSSDDLVHWRFERVALSVQPDGIMGPNRVGERVKVMRCPTTGEYVMYMHSDDLGYKDPYIAYATSRTINGEYQFHGPLLYNGKPVKRWDMGTFQDIDGKGYLLIHHGPIYRLSEDYRSIDTLVADVKGSGESPAMFKKDGTYYLLYSNLTSWEKNDNFYFTAPSIEGPWTKQGLFCPENSLTHNSQTTFVFPLKQGNDTIPMFMGDRWSYPHQASAATYVWMPLQVKGNKISIPEYWQSWNIKTMKPIDMLARMQPVSENSLTFSEGWTKRDDTWESNTKGAVLSVKFNGNKLAITGISQPTGGYTRIRITKDGKEIYTSLVDFYSKHPENAIRFITPKFEKGNYELQVEVTGIMPTWTDKTKTIYGSKGTYVSITGIYSPRT